MLLFLNLNLLVKHSAGAMQALLGTLPEDVNSRVADVTEYIFLMWIDSQLWPTQSWSVFKETVRTNNDVEGWRTRLNTKSLHGNLDMYQLAPLLHAEAMHTYILYRLWSLISISTVLARPK